MRLAREVYYVAAMLALNVASAEPSKPYHFDVRGTATVPMVAAALIVEAWYIVGAVRGRAPGSPRLYSLAWRLSLAGAALYLPGIAVAAAGLALESRALAAAGLAVVYAATVVYAVAVGPLLAAAAASRVAGSRRALAARALAAFTAAALAWLAVAAPLEELTRRLAGLEWLYLRPLSPEAEELLRSGYSVWWRSWPEMLATMVYVRVLPLAAGAKSRPS